MARTEHGIESHSAEASAQMATEMQMLSQSFTGDKIKLINSLAGMLQKAKEEADYDAEVVGDIEHGKADVERENRARSQEMSEKLAKMDPSTQAARIRAVAKMLEATAAGEESLIASSAGESESRAFQLNEMVAGLIKDSS